MARMSKRFQIMNQYASKGTLVSVAIWCAAILLVAPPTHARRFLERTADTIIPAPPGSLGDVVPDSVISVLDLVRLRDIANGIAPAPSPTELTQGDLNMDGVIDNTDVDIVARVLLKAQGVPQVVDATSGGTVEQQCRHDVRSPGHRRIPGGRSHAAIRRPGQRAGRRGFPNHGSGQFLFHDRLETWIHGQFLCVPAADGGRPRQHAAV
ncbi:MAG: dockerin type I repeat-containing protein [bacterium]|nr:dockerin type I repeat-containing protein [bacterium]